jgi:class 3 adenylate cyclase
VVPCDPSRFDDLDACGENKADEANFLLTPSGPSKIHVTITMDTELDRCTKSAAKKADPEDFRIDDVFVRKMGFVYSTFARRSETSPGAGDNGRICGRLEDAFAAHKYTQFRGAFQRVSFLMAIGTFGFAAKTVVADTLWVRVGILAGVVAPFYLIYGIFISHRESTFLKMSGSCLEKQLLVVLCLHGIAICCAEFARDKLDYGMLVMHIGFVHNFTPLSAGAMHLVSAGFGLVPYSLFKVIIWLEPSLKNSVTSTLPPVSNTVTGDMCISTTGDASLILELLVPWVALFYQVVVTSRRDMSMRLDYLSSEYLATQRNQLAVEKQKCEDLLSSMLPRQIIVQLKANEPIEPQKFDDVTVIFVEICDFPHLCMQMTPKAVVEVLNIIYLEFDRLSDLLRVYKVETVGQVYMAVVGCPEPVANHADVAAHFALAAQQSMALLRPRIDNIKRMADAAAKTESQGSPERYLSGLPSGATPQSPTSSVASVATNTHLEVVIRVGLNSGGLRAGVVGLDSPRYKLVGDTVNTASRMESTCERGRCQVSASAKERLTPDMFSLEERGEIPVKGKGVMKTAFLNGYMSGSPLEPRTVMIEMGPPNPLPGQTPAADGAGNTLAVCAPNTQSTVAGKNVYAPSDPARVSSVSTGDALEGATSMLVSSSPSTGAGGYALVNAALKRDQTSFARDFERARSAIGSGASSSTYGAWQRFQLMFLLVPESQKQPDWIATLKNDAAFFQEETVQKRIALSRNLTIIWQLILAIVAGVDYFMDVMVEDLERYRRAVLFRVFGLNLVGMIYLLLLTSPELFRRRAQSITFTMLLVQGCALLACGMIIYNSEVAVISMYGAYVLFFTVCPFYQRMWLCGLTAAGYVGVEFYRCDINGVIASFNNISFVIVFFSCMACGVRLDEHLSHVAHYEQRRVTRRLEVIKQAKAAGSQLLESLLPPHVVTAVGEGISPIAEHHSDVTIIFTDIKGFTAYSSKISPHELVDFLNGLYSAFDEVIVNWQLHKVEIIGDAYFVSAGCPPHEHKGHRIEATEYAMRAVEVALLLQRTLPTVCEDPSVQMRVGLHTGSVVAGVVGKKGPRYHLFGPSVGYAEKMESSGLPGRVQISDATYKCLLAGGHDYNYEPRTVELEGEDEPVRTWLVNKCSSKQAFQIQKRLMQERRRSYDRGATARGPADKHTAMELS